MAEAPELMAAIRAYISAPDWEAARAVVEAHSTLLLSDAAEAAFHEMVHLNQLNPPAAEMCRVHLQVLQWCRREGIETAFRRAQQA